MPFASTKRSVLAFENIYNECMQYELRQEGLRFDRWRAVPLVDKGQKLKSRYYIDPVVENP